MITDQELPRLEIEESTADYARLMAEPLPRGFGTTLGSALRRILLSALPGAAVVAVRIDQVQHEFSTIPHMKEDITEFLLNVRGIRLRALSDRPAKLFLDVTGVRSVTAGDLEVPGDYEIVNPDFPLATLDSPPARLTVTFDVERGAGYLPAAEGDGLPIGVIPIDAVFTPVRKVNYMVQPTRVGQQSDLDRLILEVWTDGTITGVEAVSQSADVLREELGIFSRLGKPEPPVVEHGVGRGLALPADQANTPIEDLGLSVRAYNCLKRSGLMTVGAVLEKSEDELLALRNFGRKSYDELKARLIELEYLPPSSGESEEETGEDGESLSPLGAALIRALKEAGEDPSELEGGQEAP